MKPVRNWVNKDHKKYWASLTALKEAEKFLQGPFVERTKEILKLTHKRLSSKIMSWMSCYKT
jgi:hypothetical protein